MSASSATRNFRIEVTNGYGQQPQSISRSLYSTIVAVAEPQRTTTFTLVGAERRATVSWNVVEAANPANRSAGFACASSTTPSINCTFSAPTLEYDVSAEAAGARVVLRVTCKYVRREMRSLSEDDRRRYLTALQTVYRTSTREGRARYGADFVGGEFFALWHLGRTGNGNQFHGAPSFFTSHAAFGAILERSLQSVEPTTAAHYYDYTISNGAGVWAEQPFFTSASWFGPLANATSDGEAVTGDLGGSPWSGILVPRNNTPYASNSYGLATEPYNNNDAKFLTRAPGLICGADLRAQRLPGCAELRGTFAQTRMSDFNDLTLTDLHQNLHAQLGGMWGCSVDISRVVASARDASGTIAHALGTVALSLNGVLEALYFSGNLTCPSSCGDATPFAACQCSCPAVNDSTLAHWLESLLAERRLYESGGAALATGLTTGERDRVDGLLETHVVAPLARVAAAGEQARGGGSVRDALFEFDGRRWAFRGVRGATATTPAATPAGGGAAPGAGATGGELAKEDDHEDAAWYEWAQALLGVASLRLACSPPKMSQMASPLGSATDPMFWPFHVNFEKNWAFMRLARHFNSTWGGGDGAAAATHAAVSYYGWGFHEPLEPFGDQLVVGATPPADHEFYTNAELVDLFDPASALLPYIWDEFSYAHCLPANHTPACSLLYPC